MSGSPLSPCIDSLAVKASAVNILAKKAMGLESNLRHPRSGLQENR